MNNSEFEIRGIYANRRGHYEVINLDEVSGVMEIMYFDNGEIVETSIKEQILVSRVVRRRIERTVHKQGKSKRGSPASQRTSFSGLKDTDFSTTIEGTRWRSRQSLAGRVAAAVSEGAAYTFKSWAIYPWNLAFLSHREDYDFTNFEDGSSKAKYNIELDNEDAYFGFYVERFNGPMDASWDWPRLMIALQSNDNLQNVIVQAETNHGAALVGRMSTGEKTFHYANGIAMGSMSLWDEDRATSLPIAERLKLLNSIPDNYWGELYIVVRLAREEAIAARVSVADTIASVMQDLMPIYKAAVG